MNISTDIINIIDKYIPKLLYAGYIIKRYAYGYIPNHMDNPIIVIIDKDKYNIFNKLIEYGKRIMNWEKCMKFEDVVIIGICIVKIEIGNVIGQIEWNNCQAYFDNSTNLDRIVNIDEM